MERSLNEQQPAGERIQHKANYLSREIFLGGSVEAFDAVGRLQLITLLRCGLYPDSKVLDIGCGCLRSGYWLIHFLNRGCYCGIEPNAEMLDRGKAALLSPEVMEQKTPRFDTNDQFDAGPFGERFDFFLARSVWTHASKRQIEQMLDSFAAHAADDGLFLTSYLPAGERGHEDYTGDAWVGRSHESDEGGYVGHARQWVERACERRGLLSRELDVDFYGGQVWLAIGRAGAQREVERWLKPLQGDLHRRPIGGLRGLLRRLRGA